MKNESRSKWTWILPLTILAGMLGLYFVWPGYRQFVDEAYRTLSSGNQQQVEEWVSGFGAWGFVAIIALMLLQTLLPFLPSLLPMVIAVVAFGPLKGGIVAWAGLLIAACVGFGIGRAFGPVTIDRLIGGKTEEKVERFVERYGLWAVVAARISPILSTDAVSIVAGLVKMQFRTFVTATAAGTLPLTVLIAFLGSETQRLKTGLIVISIVSAAVFIAYVIYDRRRRE